MRNSNRHTIRTNFTYERCMAKFFIHLSIGHIVTVEAARTTRQRTRSTAGTNGLLPPSPPPTTTATKIVLYIASASAYCTEMPLAAQIDPLNVYSAVSDGNWPQRFLCHIAWRAHTRDADVIRYSLCPEASIVYRSVASLTEQTAHCTASQLTLAISFYHRVKKGSQHNNNNIEIKTRSLNLNIRFTVKQTKYTQTHAQSPLAMRRRCRSNNRRILCMRWCICDPSASGVAVAPLSIYL